MAENTLSGSAGRPRPMARPFVGTRAAQPSPASRRGPQQVVPPFGPPGRATPESDLAPVGSTVAVIAAAEPAHTAAAIQTVPPATAVALEVADTADELSSVADAGDDWFAESAHVGLHSDHIDTPVAELARDDLVAPTPANSWLPATTAEELTSQELDSVNSCVESEPDLTATNTDTDSDQILVQVAQWEEIAPTDQTMVDAQPPTVDAHPQTEHRVVEDSWQSEPTPPQEDDLAASDQASTHSIEEQHQTSELPVLSDYTGVQFDDLATTEPAALISTDLTGPEPDPNRDRIAVTLERLATRIRNGEIALSQSANAGSETAVLASVLTTLLSDAI